MMHIHTYINIMYTYMNNHIYIYGGLDLVSRSFTDYLIPSVYLNEWLANRLISPNIEIK